MFFGGTKVYTVESEGVRLQSVVRRQTASARFPIQEFRLLVKGAELWRPFSDGRMEFRTDAKLIEKRLIPDVQTFFGIYNT